MSKPLTLINERFILLTRILAVSSSESWQFKNAGIYQLQGFTNIDLGKISEK